jgi:hypothetical protein
MRRQQSVSVAARRPTAQAAPCAVLENTKSVRFSPFSQKVAEPISLGGAC